MITADIANVYNDGMARQAFSVRIKCKLGAHHSRVRLDACTDAQRVQEDLECRLEDQQFSDEHGEVKKSTYTMMAFELLVW